MITVRNITSGAVGITVGQRKDGSRARGCVLEVSPNGIQGGSSPPGALGFSEG